MPDSWKEIILAPLYDVHIGNSSHDASLFAKHVRWIAGNPHVLTWNGGDMVEQATKLSIGAGVYEQDFSPQNQLVQALLQLSSIRHKMLFAIPGNHEDRQNIVGSGCRAMDRLDARLELFQRLLFCRNSLAGQ